MHILLLSLVCTVRTQAQTQELVVQRADSGGCQRVAVSHDGRLLATDDGSKVLVWQVRDGRLLKSMKMYLSPVREGPLPTGGLLFAKSRADGTLAFSPDDQNLAVLSLQLGSPLNFGSRKAPPLIWNVDSGLPLTTAFWEVKDGSARSAAAPSTSKVVTWTLVGNRPVVATLLEKGLRVQAISAMGAASNDEPRNEQRIQLTDLKTGQVLRTLDPTFGDVLGMAFSPDARFFAAHSGNRQYVTVWETSSGREVAELKQDVQYPWVDQITFSPDDKWLAVEFPSEIALYETKGWTRPKSLPLEQTLSNRTEIVFSPDSALLAEVAGSVKLVDIQSGSAISTVCSSPLHSIEAVAWDAAKGTFATAGAESIKLWYANAQRAPAIISRQVTVRALTFSPDGQSIAMGTQGESRDGKGHLIYEGETSVWDAESPKKPVQMNDNSVLLSASGASFGGVAFSPDGKLLASAMQDVLDDQHCVPDEPCGFEDINYVGLLTLWDAATGKSLRHRSQPDPELNVITYSPDGKQIATAHQVHIVKIYDAHTLDRVRAFKDPLSQSPTWLDRYSTTALAYSPDGHQILAGASDGIVWVLDVEGKNQPRLLLQNEEEDPTAANAQVFLGSVVAAFFSKNGKRAFIVASTGAITVWDAGTWTKAGAYQTPEGASSAAMSPNGRVLAVANVDGAVRFYTTDDAKLQLTLVSTGLERPALVITPEKNYDISSNKDLDLAALCVGRICIAVDQLPTSHRIPGLFNEFLTKKCALPSNHK